MFADLPCVLSGQYLAMSDPHSTYFQKPNSRELTTGYRWNLAAKSKIRVPMGHTLPYLGICDCNQSAFTNGTYKGTLFRFPLRQTPSELSDTIYDQEQLMFLFKHFSYDAHLLLMFLKNVEQVELSIKKRDSTEPSPQFFVHIVPECLPKVREQRKTFANMIKDSGANKFVSKEPFHITYLLTVETKNYMLGEKCVSRVYKWLVTEYCAGGEISKQLHDLTVDPVLGYVPLVGIAMDITDNTPQAQIEDVTDTNLPNASEASTVASAAPTESDGTDSTQPLEMHGQVFCFLPLPIEQKSASGLPVHVNGYFAISQNRRHLKWPTEGQNSTGQQKDKMLSWNHCLLQELLPKAYEQMIMKAIAGNKQKLIDAKYIMKALPNMWLVNEKWQVIIPPLYESLLKKKIFYTESNEGKWLTAEQSWFDCVMHESAEMTAIIGNLLVLANAPLVSCPEYLLTTIGAFTTVDPHTVSSYLVRRVIRENSKLMTFFSPQQKLHLLQ